MNLNEILEKGFNQAGSSLTTVVSHAVKPSDVTMGLYTLSDEEDIDIPISKKNGSCLTFYAEIKGEITGKCYLALTQGEFEILSRIVFGNRGTMVDIKEEFMKELASILACAIISVFANESKLKMGLDIPQLNRTVNINFQTSSMMISWNIQNRFLWPPLVSLLK